MDNINWFPGHMAKARRQMSEQLKCVDIVIEICDARLPYSSRNPDLDKMIAGKRRILVINKADLADPYITEKWLSYFRKLGILCFAINANRFKRAEAIQIINSATQDIISGALRRGVHKTVRALVVGVPNVGKSTYINRLKGQNTLDTADRPGVTKSGRWVKISPYLEMLDTPGLLWPRLDRQDAARRLCYIGTVSDSAIDSEEIAEYMLRDIARIAPDAVMQRFRINEESLEAEYLIEEVCYGRGYLLKGGKPDTVRCAAIVMDEFRGGKLGRITLEDPNEINNITEVGDVVDKDRIEKAGTRC